MVRPLRIRVDEGIMVMMEYSTLPRILDLEPYYQIQFSPISRTPCFCGILLLCRGYSQHILSLVDWAICVCVRACVFVCERVLFVCFCNCGSRLHSSIDEARIDHIELNDPTYFKNGHVVDYTYVKFSTD